MNSRFLTVRKRRNMDWERASEKSIMLDYNLIHQCYLITLDKGGNVCVYIIHAAAAAKLLQLCLTLCDPIDGTHQAPPSLGFSRQEHWSGLPFPSPMHESSFSNA